MEISQTVQCSKGNNSRVEVPVLCTLSYGAQHLCEVHENILNRFEVTEQTRVCGRNDNFTMFKRH